MTLRQRALNGEILAGTWLNLASSITAEIAGQAGFDWLLIDREHGAGDEETLLHQLQAIASTSAMPIVRVTWNDPARLKLALDLGPGGIMVPYVSTEEEARKVVDAMRYPPLGTRGAARFTRACGYGTAFDTYFPEANASLLTIVQIETETAVENAEKIAAIDGIDVLFVGPLDLSVNLGIPQQYGHPKFRATIQRVIAAAKGRGKAAGTLLGSVDMISPAIEDGYTFLAVGSDGGLVANGMKTLLSGFPAIRKPA